MSVSGAVLALVLVSFVVSVVGLLVSCSVVVSLCSVVSLVVGSVVSVGCVACSGRVTGSSLAEMGTAAVAVRRLSNEAGNAPVAGWAHEMRAWFALTSGRFGDVIEAAQAGLDAAPGRSVSVQLHAQEAKAWARLGNDRNVNKALEKGRVLLDSLSYPDRPDNHFVVDPDKFDFYAMDCYRLVGNDTLAEMHARETIRKITSYDGRDLSPMRMAEAELTLGVVAARRGDPESAAEYGARALTKARVSGPSLLMVGSELKNALRERYPQAQETRDFEDALVAVGRDMGDQ